MIDLKATFFLLLLSFFFCFVSCGGKNTQPLSPGLEGLTGEKMRKVSEPIESGVTDQNVESQFHTLFGFWNVRLDFENRRVDLIEDRTAYAHFDITKWLIPPKCSDCLEINIKSIDHVNQLLTFDVTIRNPFPGIEGRCVRGIIISDDPNHDLANADGYTTFWDTHDPVHINPFIGFPAPSDTNPFPAFEGGAEYTREYQLTFGDPPGFPLIKYAIDASYPGPPDEPALLNNIDTDGVLYQSSGSLEISLKAYDAQKDIDLITVDTSIFTGDLLELTGQPDGVSWSGKITNELQAPPGQYRLLITATSENSGNVAMYQYGDLTVEPDIILPPAACYDIKSPPPYYTGQSVGFDASCSDGDITSYEWSWNGDPEIVSSPLIDHVFDSPGLFEVSLVVNGPGGKSDPFSQIIEIIEPVELSLNDITPDELLLTPEDVEVCGDYAFIGADCNGLVVFDISNKCDPVFVKRVTMPGHVREVTLADGYAWCLNRKWENKDVFSYYVVDIDPPETAHIVSHLVPDYDARSVLIDNDRAFVGGSKSITYYLEIYDISDLAEPQLITSVNDISVPPYSMFIEGDLLYSVGGMYLEIIDCSDIENPYVLNSVHISYSTCLNEVYVSNGYAYMAGGFTMDGFFAVDIDPPADAEVVFEDEDIFGTDFEFYSDYLLISSNTGNNNVWVMDISVPGEPVNCGSVQNTGGAESVAVHGDYLITTNFNCIRTLSYDPPLASEILHTLNLPCSQGYGLAVKDDYMYFFGAGHTGFLELDISIPTMTHITGAYSHKYFGSKPIEYGDYVYTPSNGVFKTLDLSEPGSPQIINELSIPGDPLDMVIDNGFAYCVTDNSGVHLIDLTLPDAPKLVKTVTGIENGWSIACYGDYLYVTTQGKYSGTKIIDKTDPENAYIAGITAEEIEFAKGVHVIGDYLYLGQANYALQVLDLSDPVSPVVAASLNATYAERFFQYGSILFTSGYSGMWAADISDPANPQLIDNFNIQARWIEITPDDYAFTVCSQGIRIYEVIW